VDQWPLPLSGARPLTTPVSESSDRRADEGEGGQGNSMAGSPRLGRWWKGGSPAAESSARKDDVEGAVRARREGFGGVGASPGAGSAFIGRRQGGGGPSAFNGRLEEASMVGLKAPVSRIEEGGNDAD
jgi:hypothetical protein